MRKRTGLVMGIAIAVCAGVWTWPAPAAEGATHPPAVVLPAFGDALIDAALAKLSRATEIALVQENSLKALAAKKPEAAETEAARRERLFWAILDILYPDQVDQFQNAFEEGLGGEEAAARQWARRRMRALFGRLDVATDLKRRAMGALIECYRAEYAPVTALDAAHKAGASDARAEKEYGDKREALLAPIRAKSYAAVRALLPPEQQKAMDDEWKRRQSRRIGMTLKDLGREFVPNTDEQRKRMDAAKAAFQTAAKDLDLDSPEYDVRVERLRKDLDAALNAAAATKGP